MLDCGNAAALTAQHFLPHLSYADAFDLCEKYYAKFHSSTHGFTLDYGIDRTELHHMYHAKANAELVPKDPTLAATFEGLSHSKAILTYADRIWACRVLDRVGLRPHFSDEAIHAFEDVSYQRKSDSEAPFRYVLDRHGYRADQSIMIEDSAANLVFPKMMGMITVLISDDGPEALTRHEHVDFVFPDIRALIAEGRPPRRRPRSAPAATFKP